MEFRNDIVVPGVFDLFHAGHKRLLDYAKMLGDVTVILNGDEISKKHGKKLVDNEGIRKQAVQDYIDCTVHIINSEEESLQRTLEKAPCFRLTGNDWDIEKTSKRCGVRGSFWEDHEVYLIYKDRLPNISSTKLRNALSKTN